MVLFQMSPFITELALLLQAHGEAAIMVEVQRRAAFLMTREWGVGDRINKGNRVILSPVGVCLCELVPIGPIS